MRNVAKTKKYDVFENHDPPRPQQTRRVKKICILYLIKKREVYLKKSRNLLIYVPGSIFEEGSHILPNITNVVFIFITSSILVVSKSV